MLDFEILDFDILRKTLAKKHPCDPCHAALDRLGSFLDVWKGIAMKAEADAGRFAKLARILDLDGPIGGLPEEWGKYGFRVTLPDLRSHVDSYPLPPTE